MKKIHILPTDKPSRLHYNEFEELVFTPKSEQLDGVNIYITSDEEIKKGDWCLYGFNLESVYEGGKDWEITENHVIKCINFSALGYLIDNRGTTGKEFCKKIILTTNQDLIKDGVQAIDDEFLGWFIKNPSCEFVIVRKIGETLIYNAEIKKEEPKQETLEEFTKRQTKLGKYQDQESAIKYSIELGAKWQQERMYSEEDMIEASKYGYNFHKTTQFQQQEFEDSCIRNTQQWLTKFKNK